MTLPKILTSTKVALFLDFDGTLVEIAEHPEAVVLGDATRRALGVLSEKLDGALAIVTGREIEAIDRFLAPLADNPPVLVLGAAVAACGWCSRFGAAGRDRTSATCARHLRIRGARRRTPAVASQRGSWPLAGA